MLTRKDSNETVKVKLLVDMIVDGEAREKGETVELSGRDFRYLAHHNRVELAKEKK